MNIYETLKNDAINPQPGEKEPIKLPDSKFTRRIERQKRRADRSVVEDNDNPASRQKNGKKHGKGGSSAGEADIGSVVPENKDDKPAERSSLRSIISVTMLSFLLMVVLPTALTGYYYLSMASPQYQVETQFSVRGSNQSSIPSLGLGSLFGNSVQSSDSYIVASYIESTQMIRDIKKELGIDLRDFYARPDIDFVYRIKPDMPIEKFAQYWKDMIEVSFNSTTGNTAIYVYAFRAEDAKAIADAVLKVSDTLVNNLSESSRIQLTEVASHQVTRAEEKLRAVRDEIRKLRLSEKALDPGQIAALQGNLTQTLENQLSSLKTRIAVLVQDGKTQSPTARVIRRQIKALEDQLEQQRGKLGVDEAGKSLTTPSSNANLAEVMNKFEELNVEQGFATQAYTTALATFEAAVVEAQKQERYFATFVAPTVPEIALFPTRFLDTFIAFIVFLAIWMGVQFTARSVRDHAL